MLLRSVVVLAMLPWAAVSHAQANVCAQADDIRLTAIGRVDATCLVEPPNRDSVGCYHAARLLIRDIKPLLECPSIDESALNAAITRGRRIATVFANVVLSELDERKAEDAVRFLVYNSLRSEMCTYSMNFHAKKYGGKIETNWMISPKLTNKGQFRFLTYDNHEGYAPCGSIALQVWPHGNLDTFWRRIKPQMVAPALETDPCSNLSAQENDPARYLVRRNECDFATALIAIFELANKLGKHFIIGSTDEPPEKTIAEIESILETLQARLAHDLDKLGFMSNVHLIPKATGPHWDALQVHYPDVFADYGEFIKWLGRAIVK